MNSIRFAKGGTKGGKMSGGKKTGGKGWKC